MATTQLSTITATITPIARATFERVASADCHGGSGSASCGGESCGGCGSSCDSG